MTIREEKIERYEEALFTLWADEVAVREGRDLERENAALRLDANFRVPEEVVRRGRELISRKLAARTARSVGHHAWRLVHAAALVCLFSILAFSAAFAASPTFRANTLNLVIETFDEGTRFKFAASNSSNFSIDWIPDGFELDAHDSDSYKTWYEFKRNSDNAFIFICKTMDPNVILSIDTENGTTKSILINDYSAFISSTEHDTQLLITLEEEKAFIQIISDNLTQSDFIQIAENLKF